MQRPAVMMLLFFLLAVAVEGLSLLLSRAGAPPEILNLWTLSVGMIGLTWYAALHTAERHRAVAFLSIACAALLLYLLRALLPSASALFQLGLLAALLTTCTLMLRRPLAGMGLAFARQDLRWIGVGLGFGLLPTLGPYLVLRLAGRDAIQLNSEWWSSNHLGHGLIHLGNAGVALLLNAIVGEEAGWRGWLTLQLKGLASRRTLVWGGAVLFALWHVPFDLLVSKMTLDNLIANQIFRLLAGAAYTYFFIASGGRLGPVSAFHATYDFALYELLTPKGPFVPSVKGLEGLAVVGLYFACMIVLVRVTSRLARNDTPAWIRGQAAVVAPGT